MSSGGKQHLVEFAAGAVGEHHLALAPGPFDDARGVIVVVKLDAAPEHTGFHRASNVGIEAAQDALAPVIEHNFGAQPAKYAGEFDCNIAAADDQQASRKRWQVECIV